METDLLTDPISNYLRITHKQVKCSSNLSDMLHEQIEEIKDLIQRLILMPYENT